LINGNTKANMRLITGYTNNQLIKSSFHFFGVGVKFSDMIFFD
jgi:hypothetical protein